VSTSGDYTVVVDDSQQATVFEARGEDRVPVHIFSGVRDAVFARRGSGPSSELLLLLLLPNFTLRVSPEESFDH
jgi:hypothetical protein